MRYVYPILCKVALPMIRYASVTMIVIVVSFSPLDSLLSNKILSSRLAATTLPTYAAQRSELQKLTAPIDPQEIIRKCQESYGKVEDFTATFVRRERIRNNIRDVERIKLKFRKKPFSVYLKWTKNPHKGREVIYVKGQNKGKIIAHTGGPIDINVKRDPDYKSIMLENREPITHLGIGHIISSLAAVFDENDSKKRSDFQLFYLGIGKTTLHTQNADQSAGQVYKLLAITNAKNDENPFYFVIVEIDKKKMLPICVACYDRSYMLQAYYAYEDLKLNTGLTKNDFDPKNKEYLFYKFPINLNPFE